MKRHRIFEKFSREGKTIEFLFVEKNPEYYRHLQRKIDECSWPRAFKIEVKHGEFERALIHLLDEAATGNQQMPPTLLFVDPFGPAGFPMELLERLASFDRVDVLINLNHLEFVQWILPDPSKHVTRRQAIRGEEVEACVGPRRPGARHVPS